MEQDLAELVQSRAVLLLNEERRDERDKDAERRGVCERDRDRETEDRDKESERETKRQK